jgi:uncharacterized protein YlxW (UPF0749 family)
MLAFIIRRLFEAALVLLATVVTLTTRVREMLDLYDLRDGQVTQLRVVLEKFREQEQILREQQREIEEALDELQRTVQTVAGLLREREGAGAGERAAVAS